jgi:arylsulfatase A-like enzyme
MPPTRRAFLSSLAAPLLAESRPRNVLFIAVDDLNDWIGCLGGHPQAYTPNLDRLAARGVLFTNAHCTAPLCNPSRASLMTGVRPSTSGVYDNGQPMRKSPVLREVPTLPQHLRNHGYAVLGAGKIFHGAYPDPPSWDEYFPSQRKNKPDDPMPPNRPLNGLPKPAHFDWGPVNVTDADMGDSQVVDWTISQLEKRWSQPFFLACGLFRPHLPWYVPPRYFDRFPLNAIVLPRVNSDDLDDVPPIGREFARPEGDHRKVVEHRQWREAVQGYLASIAFMDGMLGRLIDAFDRSPQAAQTTIVLWSDHGWHLGEKLHWRKFTLWEEATRSVLLMVAPGVTQPKRRCARSVSLLDIYPTVCELCAAPRAPHLEGISLLRLLGDPEADWDCPAVTTYFQYNHAVRSERFRYIRYRDGGEELYDHQTDPEEWNNLAGNPSYAAIKERLKGYLPRVNAPASTHEPGVAADV